jgi:transcriptional regulator with XRE-family HTH domain
MPEDGLVSPDGPKSNGSEGSLMERYVDAGAWLKQQRGQRSVRRIAQVAGFSEAYLRQIEKGYEERRGQRLLINPSVEKLAHLADALGIPRSEITVRYALAAADVEGVPPLSEPDMGTLILQLRATVEEMARLWETWEQRDADEANRPF